MAASEPEDSRMGTADEQLSNQLAADLASMRQKEAAAKAQALAAGGSREPIEPPPSWKESLDKFLVADFLFVVFAALWLAAGAALQAGTDNKSVMDAWFTLWPVLFQPAIGVLMLASLVTGVQSWANSRGKNEDMN